MYAYIPCVHASLVHAYYTHHMHTTHTTCILHTPHTHRTSTHLSNTHLQHPTTTNRFLKPIDTSVALPDVRDATLCAQVYQDVQTRVHNGIQELLELRAQDGDRQVGPRVTRWLASQWLPVGGNVLRRR